MDKPGKPGHRQNVLDLEILGNPGRKLGRIINDDIGIISDGLGSTEVSRGFRMGWVGVVLAEKNQKDRESEP